MSTAGFNRRGAHEWTPGESVARARRRKVWRRAHLVLALSLGIFYAGMGLSGSILIFRDNVDAMLNPGLYPVQIGGGTASLDAIVAAALIGPEERVVALDLPRFGGPARVYLAGARARGFEDWREAFVDRHNATLLGSRRVGDSVVQVLYNLHARLLAGTPGRIAVGTIGVLLLSSVASGVILWWPKNGRWSSAIGLKMAAGNMRKFFDVHRTVGSLAVPVVVAIALTGAYKAFEPEIKPTLDRIEPSSPPADRVVSSPSPLQPNPSRVSADTAVSEALKLFPSADFGFLDFPSSPTGSFAVAIRQPHEAAYLFWRTTVWIDQYRGVALWVRDAHAVPPLLAIEDWIFPVHDGQALGQAGRLIWFLAGLTPAALLATGLSMWSIKRNAGKRVKNVNG